MRFRFLIFVFALFLITWPAHSLGAKAVPILVYHSISEFDGFMEKELYVTPVNFEKQMTYLKEHGFTLLTFETWGEAERVKKPIFITFDDGYKNNLNAFHLLQKLKTAQFRPKGTIFVISDFIGKPYRLTDTDLKMLADSGVMSIQSHTATHPNLTKVVNFDYELGESKRKIARITGKKVIALAYPYGSYNGQVIKETQKYYRYGLTTNPGPYHQTGEMDELYLLPRTYINYSTTLDEFMKIVNVK